MILNVKLNYYVNDLRLTASRLGYVRTLRYRVNTIETLHAYTNEAKVIIILFADKYVSYRTTCVMGYRC